MPKILVKGLVIQSRVMTNLLPKTEGPHSGAKGIGDLKGSMIRMQLPNLVSSNQMLVVRAAVRAPIRQAGYPNLLPVSLRSYKGLPACYFCSARNKKNT